MDYWLLMLFFFAGLITFSLTTLTAGGGGLILIPLVNYIAGSGVAAPILNTGNLIGRPVRLIIYREHIDWKATLFYVPAALIGAFLGAMIFIFCQDYLAADLHWLVSDQHDLAI